MPISNPSSNNSTSNNSSVVNHSAHEFLDNELKIILPANSQRKGLSIYNDLSAEVYIDVVSNALTSGTYMAALPVGALYEMPLPIFTGEISAHSVQGNTGRVFIREFE